METYSIKRTKFTGNGLFASKDIKKGELILHVDLSRDKTYSRKEISSNPKLQSEHCDYAGRGKYTISFHPYSYMNHSCNPNVFVKHKTIKISDFIAMKDIKKGEELTYDYGVNAMDQFERGDWVINCKCGEKNCRKKIPGSFFKQPQSIQKKYYKYLPYFIRRKYKKYFLRLVG
jgi:hypothetical protein